MDFTGSIGSESKSLQSLPAPSPAQIRELLRLHFPPPTHLSSTLSAITNELARYDMEIARVQKKLDQLVVDRASFQTRHSDYTSLLAPIRRLPSEILVEIFGLCWDSFTPDLSDVDKEGAPLILRGELARLAHAPLLTLSQVCVRWHNIALGTPALWACIELEGPLWTAPHRFEDIMALLQSALERSANHPLAITVTNDYPAHVSVHAPALNLLAQHCRRWQRAEFNCPFSDLVHLSSVKNNLPCLRFLEVFCWAGDGIDFFTIFENAPQLKHVDFSGNTEIIGSSSLLPLEQLVEVRSVECIVEEPPAIVALMHRLSQAATLWMHLSPGESDDDVDFSFTDPPVTSGIGGFVLELSEFLPQVAGRALDKVFAHLTLPSLATLQFDVAKDSPGLPLPWPHSTFISLSRRSLFHAHLRDLDLQNVIIQEAELLESLVELPALKVLYIADHLRITLDNSVEQVLVTNTLLTAFARSPDSACLVPELDVLKCCSMLRFDDSVLLDCVTSRLDNTRRFTFELWWLPGHGRELDATVHAQIGHLSAKNRLAFSLSPAQ
ncbi:hypothetical protein C8F04DRAFT_348604 [Mycena alexandri]|uniref:F-box domain-containing protein n=1 Tax=Mycena alexandri TaxID=1745969 RepID=A0AAD6T4Q7_9AGAR|nr:hypothetical protein C8F04DRAFT_348604 [Mycena alexandri]